MKLRSSPTLMMVNNLTSLCCSSDHVKTLPGYAFIAILLLVYVCVSFAYNIAKMQFFFYDGSILKQRRIMLLHEC